MTTGSTTGGTTGGIGGRRAASDTCPVRPDTGSDGGVGAGPAAGPAGIEWLDAALAARPVREAVGLTIRVAHRQAVEVIARRHRYEVHALELRASDVGETGLLWVELRPVER